MNSSIRYSLIGMGLISGLVLIGTVIAMGWMQRSLWVLPILAFVFVILYIYGKQPEWKTLVREKPVMVLPSFFGTYLIQLVMVGVFYLIGFGAKSLLGSASERAPLANMDFFIAGGLLLVGLVLGTFVNQMSKHVYDDLNSFIDDTRAKLDEAQDSLAGYSGASESSYDVVLTGEPVTPQSLISNRHYSHADSDPAEGQDVENRLATGGDDKIAEAEKRLGQVFPESLRAIYRIHNGGSINNVCIPKDDAEGPELAYEDITTPFSGYDDLNPLERLETAWESFTAFGDPEDTENYGQFFRSGTENMIVLAQWYRETLFLDYNEPGDPRVGFVDFEDEDWENTAIWWPSFDAFFAALRHFEEA